MNWPSDVRVNGDSGTTDQWYPAAAADENGDLFIVWVDDRDDDTHRSDIYAQKLDDDGAHTWATDVRVNRDAGWTMQSWPDVRLGDDGSIVIIWSDWRSGNGDIYAQKLDPHGTSLWFSHVRVSQAGDTSYQWGEVAVDENGYAVEAWMDDRPGQDEVYVQWLSPAGNATWRRHARPSWADLGAGTGGKGLLDH